MMNLKMTEKNGKTIDEAVDTALAELGIDRNDAVIEIIDEGSKGFLGFGGKEAKVRVTEKVNIEKSAVEFLKSMVTKITPDVAFNVNFADNCMKIEMSGSDMGILIGRRGETLDSLQYLTSLMVNKVSDEYIKVILDTENYREKRYETLVRLARRLASQVARSGKSITLEPMNPGERRIIHSTLQNNRMVYTSSIGEEPNRRVVIALGSGKKED